jgi:hypothetical protein
MGVKMAITSSRLPYVFDSIDPANGLIGIRRRQEKEKLHGLATDQDRIGRNGLNQDHHNSPSQGNTGDWVLGPVEYVKPCEMAGHHHAQMDEKIASLARWIAGATPDGERRTPARIPIPMGVMSYVIRTAFDLAELSYHSRLWTSIANAIVIGADHTFPFQVFFMHEHELLQTRKKTKGQTVYELFCEEHEKTPQLTNKDILGRIAERMGDDPERIYRLFYGYQKRLLQGNKVKRSERHRTV